MYMFQSRYFSYLVIFTLTISYFESIRNKFFILRLKEKKFYRNLSLILLLFIHNMIYFGIYFTLPLLIFNFEEVTLKHLFYYLLILIIVPLHWYTNNNKCWFTVKQNKLLGIDINTGFRDFIAIFNNTYPEVGTMKKKNFRDNIYYYYLYFAIGITIFMIYKKYKQ